MSFPRSTIHFASRHSTATLSRRCVIGALLIFGAVEFGGSPALAWGSGGGGGGSGGGRPSQADQIRKQQKEADERRKKQIEDLKRKQQEDAKRRRDQIREQTRFKPIGHSAPRL